MKLRTSLLLAAIALAGCSTENLTTPELYQNSCARCHGAEGRGVSRYLDRYPYLDLVASPMVRQGDRAAVRQRIVEGDGPMPGFSRRLSPAQIERLVDFTLQLGQAAKETH